MLPKIFHAIKTAPYIRSDLASTSQATFTLPGYSTPTPSRHKKLVLDYRRLISLLTERGKIGTGVQLLLTGSACTKCIDGDWVN
jgi:hypothetical protein